MSEHRDDYREQTEEDLLNVPPMGTTQKTILIVAGVGVVCAVAYVVLTTMGVI